MKERVSGPMLGRRAVSALAIALLAATFIAGSASAGSGVIDCVGDNRPIENVNDGPTHSTAKTASNGQCGVVKISSKVYVGGGVYAWDTPQNFGTSSGVKLHQKSATLSQSRHYWDFYGNPTSKLLNL